MTISLLKEGSGTIDANVAEAYDMIRSVTAIASTLRTEKPEQRLPYALVLDAITSAECSYDALVNNEPYEGMIALRSSLLKAQEFAGVAGVYKQFPFQTTLDAIDSSEQTVSLNAQALDVSPVLDMLTHRESLLLARDVAARNAMTDEFRRLAYTRSA